MKKTVIFISLLLFTLTLSAKNISDDKAQQNVDKELSKVISEEMAKLKRIEDEGSMLLSSNIDLSQSITWEKIYDVLLNHISSIPETLQQKYPEKDFSNINISKKSFKKNNMFLNYILLDDIKMTGLAISDIVNKLNKSVCYDSNYSYQDKSTNYQSSKTGKYFCDNNKDYKELLAILENLSQVGGEIYKYSYEYEKSNFIKQNKFDISQMQTYPLVETLFNYMNIIHNKDSLYHLENIRALQNTKDGVLVKGSEIYSGDIYPDKVAIIYTKKKFVDGEHMYPYGKVKFVGTYDYVSTLGVNKTVYAYKFFDVDKLTDNLYFYPEFKKTDSMPTNSQSLMFDSLIEVAINGKKVPFEEFIKYLEKLKK